MMMLETIQAPELTAAVKITGPSGSLTIILLIARRKSRIDVLSVTIHIS